MTVLFYAFQGLALAVGISIVAMVLWAIVRSARATEGWDPAWTEEEAPVDEALGVRDDLHAITLVWDSEASSLSLQTEGLDALFVVWALHEAQGMVFAEMFGENDDEDCTDPECACDDE